METNDSRVPIVKVTWAKSLTHINDVVGLWRIAIQPTTHRYSIAAKCFWLSLNGYTF